MRTPLFIPAALFLGTFLGGCDTTGPGGGVPIFISATWEDVADPTHTITFRTLDDGLTSGVVAGTENGTIDGFPCAPCSMGGAWRNGRLDIVIARGGDVYAFRANFTEPRPATLTFQRSDQLESFTIAP